MMNNYFESAFKGKLLVDQITNPNIKAGRYSYYSGYYHGHSFDDYAWYKNNQPSVNFYLSQGFVISSEQECEHTGHMECTMRLASGTF